MKGKKTGTACPGCLCCYCRHRGTGECGKTPAPCEKEGCGETPGDGISQCWRFGLERR
jgi:hypothetical protein